MCEVCVTSYFRDSTVQSGLTRFDIHTVAQFEEHNSTVWRVCWNITGTILASSGDDGFVRLWKGKLLVQNIICIFIHIQISASAI